MLRFSVSMAVVCLWVGGTLNAEIIRYDTTQQRYTTAVPVVGRFFHRSFLTGVMSAHTVIDFDRDTQMARVISHDFNIRQPRVAPTWTNLATHRETITQPFPDPPIVETYTITESVTVTGFSGGGSLLPSTESKPIGIDILNEAVFPFRAEAAGPFDLALAGTYTLTSSRGPTMSFDFTYSPDEFMPRDTLARISLGGVAKVNFLTTTLSPSTDVLFDGMFDGQPYRATLHPLSVLITLPEPSAGVLALLGLLAIARSRNGTAPRPA